MNAFKTFLIFVKNIKITFFLKQKIYIILYKFEDLILYFYLYKCVCGLLALLKLLCTTLYYLGLLCIIRISNNFIFLGYYIFSADITYIF